MSESILEDFGSRLRRERKRLGLSQEAMAKIGGVKRATQYLYEQDDYSPNMKYLAKVLSAGVDLGFLIYGGQTDKKGYKLLVEQDTLDDVFRLADEVGRDEKGRLLDIEYRTVLYRSICKLLRSASGESIDWDLIRSELDKVVNGG